MPRNLWWILFIGFSLAGCKNGPQVSYCVIDAPNLTLRCADPKEQPFDLPITSADNYGCMSPDDWQNLLTWLKTQGGATFSSQAAKQAITQGPLRERVRMFRR